MTRLKLQGSVCLITGATSGIGRASAFELARQGLTVVLIGRNDQKSAKTAEEIISATGNSSVTHLLADLSSQRDIRSLAEQFQSKYSRLDVLINNAGTIAWTRQLSPDGVELTFALNHLSYFLLTNLLLDVLVSSAPARVVNVSSAAHFGATIDLTDVQSSREYRAIRAYRQSKLANLMFTYEMARRIRGTGVTVNAVHPGLVATNLPANGKLPLSWIANPILRSGMAMIGKGAKQGSETVVYLATSQQVSGVTGKYFVDCAPASSSPLSLDREAAGQLWNISVQLTELSSQLASQQSDNV